jgi:Domain of unknown function (DUF6970)
MKYILFILAVSLLQRTSCRHKSESSLPPCIEKKITEIKSQPKWNPPAEVNEYIYEGRNIYLFSSNCCDQYNIIYGKDCNVICAASGGLTGKGDGKCTDFFENAKHVRLVWKDER